VSSLYAILATNVKENVQINSITGGSAMIRIDIPQRGSIELQHAVFDVNGTLAVDGTLISGVLDRLNALGEQLTLHALTAGTHGNIAELERAVGFPLHIITTGEEKLRYVEQLGPASVIAFGNGINDVGMLRLAAIGVAILAGEGVATAAWQVADVLALGPVDAIDLVLHPKRLIATLRG
jgi:soluble P-type ATPase